MLLLNSRLPHLIEKDLEIMVGALVQCRSEVATLASQHTLVGCSQVLQDIVATTADRTQQAIQTLSPGMWTGKSDPIHSCLEDQEFYAVVRLSVADSAISIDFSGSSAAAKGFINSTMVTTKAAALAPFCVLWHSLPANDGSASVLVCHSTRQSVARQVTDVIGLVSLPAKLSGCTSRDFRPPTDPDNADAA